MRAAGYGKSFLSDYDSDEFVECCRKLRVLNNCRHKSCGMPLTSQQYDRLTPEVRQRRRRRGRGSEGCRVPSHAYGRPVPACRRAGVPSLWFSQLFRSSLVCKKLELAAV